MAVNPQCILKEVLRLSAGRRLCLAFSGGLDSTVLLHILSFLPAEQRRQLTAVHIDHRLHADSAAWAAHCREVAATLQIDCHVIETQVTTIAADGLEAAARKARYQALAAHLQEDQCLLTAQHQQDQAETVMLQLLRGAGSRGLAAMRPGSQLFGMQVIRPLLSVSRSDLQQYATAQQLRWLDDPSNSDSQINRNYLRQQIWPLLTQRWPAAARTLARAAEHQAEAQALLDELAEQDLLAVKADPLVATLSVPDLLHLSEARQRNVLRFFIHRLRLPLPSTINLQRVIDEVCLAATDAMPLVHWPGVEVRRYQQRLYLMPPLPPVCELPQQLDGTAPVTLLDGWRIHWLPAEADGLKQQTIDSGLSLRYRFGGERIQLAGHAQHQTLKNLFQQWQLPPWQRSRVPLLFAGETLVAIVGYGYAEAHAAEAGETGWIPVIRPGPEASFSLSDTANSGNL